MARYIDTQKVTVPRGFFNKNLGVPDLLEWLDAQPAADVVPVVRCKECEYASPSTFPTAGKEWLSCQYGIKTIAVKATHFCSYGRKKDEITKTTDS